MWNASKYILFLFCFFTAISYGQSSKKLKEQQAQILAKITETKTLLGEKASEKKLAYDEIAILQSRIDLRQELVANINKQLVKLETEIRSNKASVQALEEKIEKLKIQFKKLVKAAYKYRNKYDNLIYVFSADDVNEANKRMKYVEKLKDYRIKQIASIKRSQEDLLKLNDILAKKIAEQKQLIADQDEYRNKIKQDQLLKRKAFDALKLQETDLLAKLRSQEKKQADLNNAIAAALKKELEREMEKARKEAEKRRKAKELAEKKRLARIAAAKKDPKVTVPSEPKEPKPSPSIKTDFTVTKEVAMTGADFASNKGKLPWPVAKGTLTKKYGKHAHPVHVGVYTNNNGIDIATSKGATVRAIYKGKVSSVLVIPGAGKVVIVAHGNYRTVYTNLKEAYVQKGDVISIKQKVGSLLPSSSGKTSTAHFEIHVIKDGSVIKLNPSLWITK